MDIIKHYVTFIIINENHQSESLFIKYCSKPLGEYKVRIIRWSNSQVIALGKLRHFAYHELELFLFYFFFLPLATADLRGCLLCKLLSGEFVIAE